MSSRQLRRMMEKDKAGKQPEESDDDYQEFTEKATPKSMYEGLHLTSASEVERDSPSHNSGEDEPVRNPAVTQENNKKNKRKKKKKKKTQKLSPVDGEEDEIDKSLKEVYDILGTPEAPAAAGTPDKQNVVPDVLIVQQKHLNADDEFKRKFGSDGYEKRRYNRRAQLRIEKKSLIIPQLEHIQFQSNGLSMSLLYREGGSVYFTFDHNDEYRRRQQLMMHAVAQRVPNNFEDAEQVLHVEAMIEQADFLLRIDQLSAANALIEMVIAYMQHVAHCDFQLSNPQTRLPYKYMENRPFHIALLKYVHLLSSRACHRTALELSKILLNLDPSDPLAVLFIIDTLALRAREHQWLIDAIEYWDKERDAGYLFNMKYSKALAHYHMAFKNGEDQSEADAMLQDAMMRFPVFVLQVLSLAKFPTAERVLSCPLFASARDIITKRLKDLIHLYAKLTWASWREAHVMAWLHRNAEELADKYTSDPELQEQARSLADQHLNLFRSPPDEILRHLCVIFTMSELLADGAVPPVKYRFASDPIPPKDGINRYGYSRTLDIAPLPVASAVRDLFASLLPNFSPTNQDFELTFNEESNNPALETEMAAGCAAEPDDSGLDEAGYDMNSDGSRDDGEPDPPAASVTVEAPEQGGNEDTPQPGAPN